MNVTISAVRILAVTLDRVGPFQGSPVTVSILGLDDTPSRLFMLATSNGWGKTTVFEAIAFLFGFLDPDFENMPVGKRTPLDLQHAKIRLDLLVSSSSVESRNEHLVVLQWGGEAIARGDIDELCDETYAGLVSGVDIAHYGGTQIEPPQVIQWSGNNILDELVARARLHSDRSDETPVYSLDLPRVLLFTTTRDVLEGEGSSVEEPAGWSYSPTLRFGIDGLQWSSSLDALFVWMFWLQTVEEGDDQFDRVVERVNSVVFGGGTNKKLLSQLQSRPPRAKVRVGDQTHDLSRLSSGEKSLIQMVTHIEAQRTRHTIVLVDEADLHLHPAWQRNWMNTMSKQLQEDERMSLLFTTHSKDLMLSFAPKAALEGVPKAHRIEPPNAG